MREPKPLSSEYHKARKQLMLWSGLLFVWEFVGIDLIKAESGEGNVSTIVRAIKSPQAVPWVLLMLVVYFLFKCSVEWAQCYSDRRKVRFARVDFAFAWFFSGLAIALYIWQAISRVQLADRLPPRAIVARFALIFPVFTILGVHAIIARVRSTYRFEKYLRIVEVGFGLFAMAFAAKLSGTSRLTWRITFGLFGVGFVLLLGEVAWTMWMRFSRKSEIVQTESTTLIDRAFRFADLSAYSSKDRILIRVADLVFYILINIIGGTTKFDVEGWDNWEAASNDGRIPIYTFWHNRIFLSIYFWRHRRIVVMTSRSFDGEYIARFIQRFGTGAARGSSTRGAVSALIEMVRLMRAGCPAAFTIDGPKGPRYVAKMGAVLLAKKTGNPVLPFTIAAKNFWEIKGSWDRTQVPRPFTRARVFIAAPIFVPAETDDEALEQKRAELQTALDSLEQRGEQWRQSL